MVKEIKKQVVVTLIIIFSFALFCILVYRMQLIQLEVTLKTNMASNQNETISFMVVQKKMLTLTKDILDSRINGEITSAECYKAIRQRLNLNKFNYGDYFKSHERQIAHGEKVSLNLPKGYLVITSSIKELGLYEVVYLNENSKFVIVDDNQHFPPFSLKELGHD